MSTLFPITSYALSHRNLSLPKLTVSPSCKGSASFGSSFFPFIHVPFLEFKSLCASRLPQPQSARGCGSRNGRLKTTVTLPFILPNVIGKSLSKIFLFPSSALKHKAFCICLSFLSEIGKIYRLLTSVFIKLLLIAVPYHIGPFL